jgi:hypothetical protein
VDDDGIFSVEISGLISPSSNLVLSCLMANGAESKQHLSIRCDPPGEPDVAGFIADWMVDTVEQHLMRNSKQAERLLHVEAIAAAPSAESRRRLNLLRAMREPEPAPVDLAATRDTRVCLSDAQWTKANVGWGKVARNRYWFNEGQWEGMLLKLNGTVFAKGLYAHAKSEFVFPLGGSWKTLSATIGLRDGAASQGSAVFSVIGDGKEIFRSSILRPGQQESIRLGIAGVQQLELRAEGGEGHNHSAWAIWADPLVER